MLETEVEGPEDFDVDNYSSADMKIVSADTNSEPKGKYYENETVKLEAKSDNIFKFKGWEVKGTSNNPDNINEPLEIIMVKNTYVTAKFELAGSEGPFPVKVEDVSGGSVKKEPEQEDYNLDTPLTLTAEPNDGYIFNYWSVADNDGNKELYDRDESSPHDLTLAVNKIMNITAHFAPLSDSNPIIKFKDEEIEKTARSKPAINREVGLIFENQLRDITELNLASSKLMGSLDDIPKFPNLKFLDLRDIEISEESNSENFDLSKLNKFDSISNPLEVLKLSENKNLTNLDAISNLENLRIVEINNADLDTNDFNEALSSHNLGSIKEVDLSDNLITDTASISGDRLSDLEFLNLNNNQIDNLDGLENKNNLKELYLENNSVVNLKEDIIKDLNSLEILNLANTSAEGKNNINGTDIKYLVEIPNLKEINLKGNSELDTFQPLDDIASLEKINLKGAAISKISNENIEFKQNELSLLDLSDNVDLSNISALSQLDYIKELNLSNTNLTGTDSLDPLDPKNNDIKIDVLYLRDIELSSTSLNIVENLDNNGTRIYD
ncbi:MAG: InlB B-repeat-containing protein [Bacillota bacterium]